MGGAEGVVHEDVAELAQFGRQFGLVLLLTHVEAAVFQQHHLAGLHLKAAFHPVRHQAHGLAQQLRQARGHGGERVLGLELTLHRAAQVRRHHDGGPGVQGHADGRHAGADAGVLGDGAAVVLRHVQVGANEDALALCAALRAQIGKTDEVHGGVRGKVQVRL